MHRHDASIDDIHFAILRRFLAFLRLGLVVPALFLIVLGISEFVEDDQLLFTSLTMRMFVGSSII